jgi:WD40 repeat protein
MVISEKHGLAIFAVNHELFVYNLDPITLTIDSSHKFKRISLQNDEQEINNLKLIECGGKEFLVTVDMAGQTRMVYLKDLEKDPFKYSNILTTTQDNSTWSVDGSQVDPPRVAVGSNTHRVTVYNLESGEKSTIAAHHHNVPSVSFSPCGRFLASTSIDKTLKIWEERGGVYKCSRMCVPSQEWGWSIHWIDKTKCEIQIVKDASPDKAAISSVQRQADQALTELIRQTRPGTAALGREIFELINSLQTSRQRMFREIGT